MDLESTLKVFDLTPRDGQMILVGTVVFFTFWRLVDSVIFKPFLKLYETREALTSGAAESSRAILDEAAGITKEVEDKIQSARVAAMSEKIKALTEAKKKAADEVSKAEDEVQELLRKARWTRQENIGELRASVMKEADSMAKTIAERLKKPLSHSSLRN